MEHFECRYGKFPADLHFCGKCFVCEKYTRQLFFKESINQQQAMLAKGVISTMPASSPFAPPPLEVVMPGDYSYWNIQKESETRIVCLAVCEDCVNKHKEFLFPEDLEGIENQYEQLCMDFHYKFLSYLSIGGFAEKLKNRSNFFDPESWIVHLCCEVEKERSRKACVKAVQKELSDQIALINTTEEKQNFFEKFNLKSLIYAGFFAGESVTKAKKLLDNICKMHHACNDISPECQGMIDELSIICSDLVHEKAIWLNEADVKIKQLKEELNQHNLEVKHLFQLVTIPVVLPELVINTAQLPAPGFRRLQLIDCLIRRDSDIAEKLMVIREKFPYLKAEPDKYRRCW